MSIPTKVKGGCRDVGRIHQILSFLMFMPILTLNLDKVIRNKNPSSVSRGIFKGGYLVALVMAFLLNSTTKSSNFLSE